jgi:hypothetical protein
MGRQEGTKLIAQKLNTERVSRPSP